MNVFCGQNVILLQVINEEIFDKIHKLLLKNRQFLRCHCLRDTYVNLETIFNTFSLAIQLN